MPLLLPLVGLPVVEPYAAPAVSAQRHKELTLSAVLGLLLAIADERPTLFLLEDLHWSDATTLELVEQLIREAPSAPLCVILTARPEFAPPLPDHRPAAAPSRPPRAPRGGDDGARA